MSLSEVEFLPENRRTDLLEIDDALETLKRMDARKAKVVELRPATLSVDRRSSGKPTYRFFQEGGRFSRKAFIPSTMSSVFTSSRR